MLLQSETKIEPDLRLLTTKLVRAKLVLKFECFADMFLALNFLTLLDFSEQAFIFETVMRSYSRRLDFLELNPYVDYSSNIITKKTILSFAE